MSIFNLQSDIFIFLHFLCHILHVFGVYIYEGKNRLDAYRLVEIKNQPIFYTSNTQYQEVSGLNFWLENSICVKNRHGSQLR